mmetsp:Transcript_24863/g.39485  ORF Transcript_24863/g.39485 Transcript_24863/m.39485 type:complete len:178 (+) Transcript_24863:3-536(+)
MYYVFAKSADANTRNYVLQTLQVDASKLVSLLFFKCPEPERKFGKDAAEYHKYTLLTRLVYVGIKSMKKLRELIDDDEVFAKAALAKDGWNKNALVSAIRIPSAEKVQYLFSIDTVRKRCMENNDELHDILTALNAKWNDQVCATLIARLALTEEKLNALKASKDIDITRMLSALNQ